jgi:hypothetical protein|tara:strand:+ start:60 stop:761 length:702 start_codon:yes stop_codon:yes gene_type:complete
MALPKLNTQTYELEVPSTDEKIRYRPFLVKEEKILLQAQEGGETEIMDAVADVVESCTFGKLDVSKLPSFDLEYIFLKIRSKAVGEKVTLNLPFPGDENVKVPTKVDLSKVEVHMDEEHTNKIDLTDEVSVVMRYPTIKTFGGISVTKLTADDAVEMTSRCIHQVINGVETFESMDLSKEDKTEFIENLTQDQFAKVQKFFTTMPKLSHTVTLTHPKTKKKAKYKLEGMQSFF